MLNNMFSQLVLPEVKLFIKQGDEESLTLLLQEFFPQDIAELMDELKEEEQSYLFKILPDELAIDVFSELDYHQQEPILKVLDHQETKVVLNDMAPDDRTELFEDMPNKLAEHYLETLSPEEQNIAKRYMAYPEDSAARLTTPDFIKLHTGMNISDAIRFIRTNHQDKETIYYSYVLDDQDRLNGVVSLKQLILADPSELLDDILDEHVITVSANEDQEIAAQLIKKYDLLALPVIGPRDRMIGIITVDDMVDVVAEEATEDIHKMAGMLPTEDGYLETPFFEVFKNRVFWLIVLLVMQTITGTVLKSFSNVLDQVVALSFFIPLLIGTGGNAGTQSATLVIRGLSTGDLHGRDLRALLKRELLLGLGMGIILGILAFARVYFQEAALDISLVVSFGLMMTLLTAMISGTVLPVFFKALKLDPALMSGPFISTSIDIIGLVIYLQIARVILNV